MLGGTATLEEMTASTQRGILCTRFWYILGVDQRTIVFTGLTRGRDLPDRERQGHASDQEHALE
jgi:hypothetical protein